jgi:hypothetical protein
MRSEKPATRTMGTTSGCLKKWAMTGEPNHISRVPSAPNPIEIRKAVSRNGSVGVRRWTTAVPTPISATSEIRTIEVLTIANRPKPDGGMSRASTAMTASCMTAWPMTELNSQDAAVIERLARPCPGSGVSFAMDG